MPLRPIRIAYTHENTSDGLQSPPQVPQYSYSEYWRSSQHYAAVQTTASCHGFVNGNLSNVSFPSYHQSEVHGSIEGASMNGLSSLRLRSHPYGATYSAMHASMWLTSIFIKLNNKKVPKLKIHCIVIRLSKDAKEFFF